MATEQPHSHSHEPPAAAHMVAPPPSDPAQESLVSALRTSFNVLRVVMVVLVILYLCSGVLRVQPGEQGLVARFGELRTTAGPQGQSLIFSPGLHWALPDPFDKKIILTGKIQDLKVTTFLFNHPQAESTRDLAEIITPTPALNPGSDGAMLTGDRNLSHGRWEVQYQIRDAAQFVKKVGEKPADFRRLLQRLAETAIVREVAGRTVEQVTRTALDAVGEGVKRRLQAALDELETGVQVVQVVAYTIEPGAVRPAFLDVLRAENERLRLQDEAREAETEILNRAGGDLHGRLLELITAFGEAQLRGATDAELATQLGEIDAVLNSAQSGQVAVKLSDAVARADQVNESLRREFEEFNKYLEQRQTQPRITLLGLWAQMRQEILTNKRNEIIFLPSSQDLEIHVKSDPQRRIELEEERALKRQGGQK